MYDDDPDEGWTFRPEESWEFPYVPWVRVRSVQTVYFLELSDPADHACKWGQVGTSCYHGPDGTKDLEGETHDNAKA